MTANEVEVLLVEDNPQDAELTLRTLKRHNLTHNVLVVKNGEEALQFLFGTGPYAGRSGRDTPRVVLLDLKLPKVDGLEVLRHLKSDDHTKAIPVVMLTSSREKRDMIESYNLGVNSYIVKPVDFDKFAEAVAQVGLYWLMLNELPQ